MGMTNKLKSEDHKQAIAQLMALVQPMFKSDAVCAGWPLSVTFKKALSPSNWKRDSKRKGENGEIIRRFRDTYGDIWVDTFETEISPGKWSVGVEIVEAHDDIKNAYRQFVRSLHGPAIDVTRAGLKVAPVYPSSLADEEGKPTGYGAFA